MMDDPSYRLIGFGIALLVGGWVMIDANKRGLSGLAAFLWGLGTFLLLCLFLPLWLVFRPPVPDPAGPIRCRHCGEWTEPTLAYCQHCGKPVWDQRP